MGMEDVADGLGKLLLYSIFAARYATIFHFLYSYLYHRHLVTDTGRISWPHARQDNACLSGHADWKEGERMQEYKDGSELILIRKAQRGNVKAFSELYAQIYKDLYRFALFTMKHPQDAEDAVSEAVIAAYENIHKLKKQESFRSWIFTILANQCRRKRKNTRQMEELPEGLAASEQDYAEACDVRAAFMKLDEKDRIIVACSVLEGYASEEIGRMMGMNPATVRSRKARAIDRLRQILM